MNNFLKFFIVVNMAAFGWFVGYHLSPDALALFLLLVFLLPIAIVAIARGGQGRTQIQHTHIHFLAPPSNAAKGLLSVVDNVRRLEVKR